MDQPKPQLPDHQQTDAATEWPHPWLQQEHFEPTAATNPTQTPVPPPVQPAPTTAQPAPSGQGHYPLYQQTTYPNGMPVQPYDPTSLAQPVTPQPVMPQPHYAQHFAPTGQQPVMVNVNVNQQVTGFAPAAPIIVAPPSPGPGFLVRAIWFCFVGWWLGGLAIYAAYALAITVLGLPLAFLIFDKVPAILTLRGRTKTLTAATANGVTVLSFTNRPQLAFWQRALYFVLVGWWASLLSVSLGYALCLTLIGLPLGLPLLNYTGEIMTLKRN